jgi:hypothetical protein
VFVKPFNNQRKATIFGSCEFGNVIWEEGMQNNRQASQMCDFHAIIKCPNNCFPGWTIPEIEITKSSGNNLGKSIIKNDGFDLNLWEKLPGGNGGCTQN